ncbi:PREDICTED: uncharacterized protein LOC105315208, partial [Amphimedon queenslandica]|uniref:CCHC-type domain-containing protein n=1 Tax=Amphimedon queenslandica TaxID=400682 RepID=A0AAN0IRN9_AMPQE
MAVAAGSLESFDPKRHGFTKYVQRIKLYFEANNIAAGRQKSVFLSALGYETFEVISNMVTAAELTSKTLDELVTLLTNLLHPKASIVTKQYRFGCCRQREEESIADYVADLRRLAMRCDFKPAALDETLRDRFICGLSEEFIHSKLLTESDDLKFDTAVQMATMIEDAKRSAQFMQQHEPNSTKETQDVNQSTTRTREHISCYRCGGSHLANKCRFIKKRCRACGKMGHIARVCRSKTM